MQVCRAMLETAALIVKAFCGRANMQLKVAILESDPENKNYQELSIKEYQEWIDSNRPAFSKRRRVEEFQKMY